MVWRIGRELWVPAGGGDRMRAKRTGPPGWKMLWPCTEECWTYSRRGRIRVTRRWIWSGYKYLAQCPGNRYREETTAESLDKWLAVNYGTSPVPWQEGRAAEFRSIRGTLQADLQRGTVRANWVEWSWAEWVGWSLYLPGQGWQCMPAERTQMSIVTGAGGSGAHTGFRLVEEIA